MGARGDALPDAMRVLVRHQWVREHGTPRLSVLVGPAPAARALWNDWLALSGRAVDDALTFDLTNGASSGSRRALVKKAIEQTIDAPHQPCALVCPNGTPAFTAAPDRVDAMLREGRVEVPRPRRVAKSREATGARERTALDPRARSLAELTLFEALEATPGTAGRFELNQRLAVRFGAADAEIDLLSRTDKIAIEIDGYHHFADADGYRRDRRKDLLLQSQGFLVVRVLAEDVHADLRGAVRMVSEALAHRLRDARLARGS